MLSLALFLLAYGLIGPFLQKVSLQVSDSGLIGQLSTLHFGEFLLCKSHHSPLLLHKLTL